MSLMMNLIIDQGNSSAKIALFQGDEMLYFHKYEKFSKKEAEEVQKLYPYTQAIISSVTEKDEALTDFLQKNTKKFIVLSHQTPIPLKNLYKTPETLGRDRIAVCVGANHLKPNTNILVIDAGTAITYDIVNAQNEYVGGNISLGIAMRSQALHTFTAKLPLVDVKDDAPLIGSSTEDAIASGVINGVIGEMQSFIDQISAVYPQLAIFLTGGSSKCFEKRIKNQIFAYSNLVHIGLNRILNFR